ncbi:MAG TPA: TonB-dependent receptor [Candidatus Acidoferrum sp.]|nr:TonB-dependent receptor [Candidatus Acidoferrum sp.]
MSAAPPRFPRSVFFAAFLAVLFAPFSFPATNWTGVLRDSAGKPVPSAKIALRTSPAAQTYETTTAENGSFTFTGIAVGTYALTAEAAGKLWIAAQPLVVTEHGAPGGDLALSAEGQTLLVVAPGQGQPEVGKGMGGQHLSKEEVSGLPLNTRDFSKLLLLAAGTMTDTNGAANFTQQFAMNGQRGVESVFAMDGAATSDPELGGATFANFNVDAIQEVQSNSGVMPAQIGQGASGFTNVVTKRGTDRLHGDVFEFVRNAAFDARNFFDFPNPLDPRRIPPFVRNEFGATLGGPLVLPGIYNGQGKTYFFADYAGFRQVLGTTQVFAVPTKDERNGIDTTTFPKTDNSPGDTLFVPVSPAIAPLLARYPLPNDPTGSFGPRTYATSSKVATDTDQFSIRVDHKLSDKSALFVRFSLDQISGPITNPDQTVIDPSFAIKFRDHQRSAVVNYTRAYSPLLSSTTTLGYTRSTPIFPTVNHTDVALAFGDGLYNGFNSADGSIFGSYGNVYQLRHDMSYVYRSHLMKWGLDIRVNRDSTVFGTNPNGEYVFGGGPAYSPVFIPSASGQHDILPGQQLPDSLLGLLTATPFEYTISAPYRLTPMGDKFDEAAVHREAYNFYFQDTWKINTRLSLNYGLRYEINSRIKEGLNRTSVATPVGPDGNPTEFLAPGATQQFLYNPQPIYSLDKNGWGPRLAVDYALTKHTTVHAGGAITTLLPNLWQVNFVTGGFPFVVQPLVTALPVTPVPFSASVTPLPVPEPYTTSGQLLFANGSTSSVAANTPIDVPRFQKDLEALIPGDQAQLLSVSVISRNFRNGYIGTYTAGVEHDFGGVHWSTSYVGTAGIHLPRVFAPNGYQGAGPAFARFTQFDASGNAVGGYGPEYVMVSDSHSTYHSLQTSVSGSSARLGLHFATSYTFSKSIDDTSTVLGGIPANAGAILQTLAQNPLDERADKGVSTFDIRHVFSVSAIQSLPFDRLGFLQSVSKYVTAGWQLLNITTFTSGPPFTVYSGEQQTDAGAGSADRPDLLTMPDFSTSRTHREDYFGRGFEPAGSNSAMVNNNSSFFFVPVGVPSGTGPNQGRFGTLARDTFRAPAYQNWDFAIIKDTPFGKRGKSDLGILEFRAEFFNLFNIVNFGLPSNIVRGSGFGVISHTSGNSRQIQFSLKLAF